ncbi:MAG TPA: phosphoribosylaminoimidazolesuccinocarboxamide synthase [Candidatus Binatia bacterium]
MAAVERRELLYEGKAKQVWSTDDPNLVVQYFKDDATAFNAQKRGTIASKGILNNAISERLFRLLEDSGVKTHFVERLSDREMLVRRLRIFPVEVVVRNVVAGSLAQRLGLEEGRELPSPIVELYYKNDALGDPMINDFHVTVLGMASREELDTVVATSLRVNAVLQPFLAERNLTLVDFKLEYGVSTADGAILLGDEICPDTCRLWDTATRERLDKDRFRRDLGRVEEAYQEVYRRIVT